MKPLSSVAWKSYVLFSAFTISLLCSGAKLSAQEYPFSFDLSTALDSNGRKMGTLVATSLSQINDSNFVVTYEYDGFSVNPESSILFSAGPALTPFTWSDSVELRDEDSEIRIHIDISAGTFPIDTGEFFTLRGIIIEIDESGFRKAGEESFAREDLRMYKRSGFLFLDNPGGMPIEQLEILDLQGRSIFQTKPERPYETFRFPLQLGQGEYYILRASSQSEVKHVKFRY